jgi:hypothetical protein
MGRRRVGSWYMNMSAPIQMRCGMNDSTATRLVKPPIKLEWIWSSDFWPVTIALVCQWIQLQLFWRQWIPPDPYYWTMPPLLDHSYLVGKLTSSKIADTKVSGF